MLLTDYTYVCRTMPLVLLEGILSLLEELGYLYLAYNMSLMYSSGKYYHHSERPTLPGVHLKRGKIVSTDNQKAKQQDGS